MQGNSAQDTVRWPVTQRKWGQVLLKAICQLCKADKGNILSINDDDDDHNVIIVKRITTKSITIIIIYLNLMTWEVVTQFSKQQGSC